mmetsp:Transcript_84271/g.272760  ORF Transcript_84271/g.272760 Transcript_84271/m.272760 type:complete len:337 (+) Transcript_84271:210-1220(+)
MRMLDDNCCTACPRAGYSSATLSKTHEHMHVSAEALQPRSCPNNGLAALSTAGLVLLPLPGPAVSSAFPSMPYIWVNVWNCLRSLGLTLGRTFFRAASKSDGITSGSSSSSGWICINVICTAPGASGLQGLQRWRGAPSAPGRVTHRKAVALLHRRTGSYIASRTRTEMSAPLKPSVRWAIRAKSSCWHLCGVLPRHRSSSRVLASASGSGMYTRFSKRRRMAVSKSQGVFVAPRIRICELLLPTPSICARNSVLIRRAASDSPDAPRAPQSESTSSIKMTAGRFSRAISKRLRTSRSLSPIHFDTRSDDEMLKNVASASVAHALARKDLPVPGGP